MTPKEIKKLLQYYWVSKNDIELIDNWGDPIIKEAFPEVLKAWGEYKKSQKRMNDLLYNEDYD